tara:strand:+ start:246 stop:485 length:240 start_codon:yes stop_codon:yes gene_type:complete
MARRVGKYKISARESALNLTDGGTVDGVLTVTGVVTLSGITEGAGASLTSNQVYFTSSAAVTGSVGAGGTAFNVLVLGA